MMLAEEDVAALLARLASKPRFTGSESEAEARRICAAHLAESGLSIEEQPFEFSEFPGRYGVPLMGLLLVAVDFTTFAIYWSHRGAAPALGVLALGLLIVLFLARWLTRHGTSRMRWLRSRSANLVARRGNPSVWLVAHLDSKSQTIPMIARIASIVVVVVMLAIMAVSLVSGWLADVAGDLDWAQAEAIMLSGAMIVLATIPMMICFTGNRSPGAVDNASGLAAVLLAVRALAARPDVGVIVTSGEELGLAGARAYVEAHPDPAIALNCDTIDDAGSFLCMMRGRKRLAANATARAARGLGMHARLSPMIPGILADSIAFVDSGWESVTISRGNIATLARVHTSGDNLARLTGTGIAEAARLLAATVEELS